jgi:hypothetical protein
MARSPRRSEVKLEEEDAVFIVGLKPRQSYQVEVEVDDEEMFETAADRGGILPLTGVPRGKSTGIRSKELPN